MRDDKAVLVGALETAAHTYREMSPHRTLIGPDPDHSVIDPLSAAIGGCAAYQAVAGQVVFSGGSGPVLESHALAVRLFSRGARWGDDIPGAVDWLLRLLTTRAKRFRAALASTPPGLMKTLGITALELKGFWQLELLTFIRARVELRQHARTDTFNLRRVVRAETRPFIQGARVCARVGE